MFSPDYEVSPDFMTGISRDLACPHATIIKIIYVLKIDAGKFRFRFTRVDVRKFLKRM